MFDSFITAVATAGTPAGRVAAQARLENATCAARLASMYHMLERAYAASGSADREQWRCDNWSAVCAQIGAAQAITGGMANGQLMNAVTLVEKLPMVGAVFAEGLITYLVVRTICSRTGLVKDPAALRAIDAELAADLRSHGARSLNQLDADIDSVILRHDPYAVRRTEETVRTHHADVAYEDGTAYVTAWVAEPEGRAIDTRLDALAATVCDRDPRTRDQLRSAALGAMGFGWNRVPCMCERPDCDAATTPPVGGVVIHVIARHDALDNADNRGDEGRGGDPAPEPPEPDDGFEPPPDDDVDCGDDDFDCPTASSDERAAPRVGDLTAQRRALVGKSPPMLSKPLREYTIAELCAEQSADPGEFCAARPGAVLGGGVLPAPLIAQLAMHATFRPLIHPGQAPPEPRYRPSRRLADFVRARDLTCRHPGCTRPATSCQIDHVIPWPYGATMASNLACLCTEHHLLKTFWPGWSYTLSPDATAVWTDPDGQKSTSYPGSRLLFGELCTPTADVVTTGTPPPKHTAGLTMPRRAITRKQAREKRIDDERRRNAEWVEQYLRESIPPF